MADGQLSSTCVGLSGRTTASSRCSRRTRPPGGIPRSGLGVLRGALLATARCPGRGVLLFLVFMNHGEEGHDWHRRGVVPVTQASELLRGLWR